MNFLKIIISVLSIFFTLVTLSHSVTIMSVDFGSEWMKIAVVAPGIPMEIALNKESKRKTPVVISFRDGERAFGDDAVSAGMRSPSSSYAYILDLLGKSADNPIVEIYKKRFPHYKLESDPDRSTVIFRQDAETTYSVEELVAQILNYARDLAVSYTNQRIKDIVITIPPFFNQAERRALLAAAELANLKVLSLMSTNAAVALNYGMFRRKEINETAQNILFYDMGASSTIVSIASYQTIKTKDRGYTETNPQVSILGIGYDRTLGGLEMQLRVRDFLAKKFNEMKKTTKNVFEHPRALAKLMKEAAKIKNVLSANTEYLSQVEGVLDDQDFRMTVTRQEFEELCQDLFDRVQGPIDGALISSGMDIKDVNQFIIVGGNTRVPKIQSILQKIWGKELGKNINADEAAALGAVYRAADMGQGFKVMKFHVKESIVYPIEVDFERDFEKEDGSMATKVVKRSLFAMQNSYPQKKVMTFNKHTKDFGFSVNYGDVTHLSKDQVKCLGRQNVSYIIVDGVTDVFKKNQDDGTEAKGIKAHFSMDDSGILVLTGIEAIFEKNVTVEAEKEEESTFSKIGSTLSKLFSGGDDEEGANKTDASENAGENGEKSDQVKKDEKSKTKKTEEENKKTNKTEDDKKKKDKEVKFKLITVRENLNFSQNYLDLKVISKESEKISREKLRNINSAEETRQEKERLKNSLESYILDAQDKLLQENYESASTEDVRQNIKELASQLEEWLYDEGFDAEPSAYTERLKSLEKLFEPIKERVKEHEDRPEALKALHDMINASSIFLYRAQNAPDAEKYFTDVELKTLDTLIIDTQKWIEIKEEEQESTPLYEDPKLTIMLIAEKITALDREIKYLVNKAKMAKAKRDREEAEAKIKEAAEKAKAEKKMNKTEKTVNETEQDSETRDNMEQEETENVEQEEEQVSPEQGTEENEAEKNRRKPNGEPTSTLDKETHTEL